MNSRRHVGTIACGLVVGGLLALLVSSGALRLGPSREELLAQHWRQKLSRLGDDEVPAAMRQLSELGMPGIPLLVEAAGSYRASVALAARRALVDEMDRIAALSAPESGPRLAVLAHALAAHVERFGPATRGLAAYLADRILRAPLDAGAIERATLLADCQKILEVAADSRRPASADLSTIVNSDDSFEQAAHVASNASDESPQAAANPAESLLDPIAKGDGSGGVPAVETAAVPKLPRGALPDSAAARKEPRLLPEVEDELEQPQRFHKPLGVKQVPTETGRNPGDGRRAESNPEPDSTGALPRKLDNLDVEQVVALLGAGEGRVAKAAHVELERRGFSALELEIATQATSSNPNARRQLVDQLLSITGLDARPWLLMLSRDSVADVRQAAVSLLATRASDPTIAARLAEIARDERDTRISEMARRAIERSSSRGK